MLSLGDKPSRKLPALIAAADVLVQPRRPSKFNDYRFPSKLPMFLAQWAARDPAAVPPECLDLMDGKQCLHLPMGPTGGSPENLAACILRLANDKTLRIRLGQNGRAFAHRHFNWDASTKRVLGFYQPLLNRKPSKEKS